MKKKINYKTPYVKLYNEEKVLPVKQNLKNFKDFLSKREYLYQCLGVPLSFLNEKSILEFGPGGGFNATASSYYKTKLYTFVDATKQSLELVKNKIKKKKIKSQNYKIIEKNIFELNSRNKILKKNYYDLVIAEGLINAQIKPAKMTKIISGFVRNKGVLIVTSNNAASMLSEYCRKILALKIRLEDKNFNKKKFFKKMCKLFSPHLKTLGTQTRPVEDWVTDNIIQHIKFGKYKFDLEDYLKVIGKSFVFYGSSPNFYSDYLWYKKFNYKKNHVNLKALKQYKMTQINLIDCRIEPITVNFKNYNFNELYKTAQNMLDNNNIKQLDKFLQNLSKLKYKLPSQFELTKKSINEYLDLINNYQKIKTSKYFKSWWGRGQQYLSFIKLNN